MFINMLVEYYLMKPPCEYVIRDYLPQFRARIVRELVETYGWSVTSAAKALGVSSTAASKYKRIIAASTGYHGKDLDRFSKNLAEKIAGNEITPRSFIEEVCSKCMEERIKGDICKLHARIQTGLEECRSCFRVLQKMSESSLERFEILEELEKALELLSSCSELEKLIPEVRTNIVMCTKSPSGLKDVAAFPGRLTFINGSIRAFSKPEFGSSRHMSSVLLAANSVDPSIRSAMCIKYDEKVDKAMVKCRLKKAVFDRSKHESIELFIKSLRTLGDAIIDRGGVGIEPVAYVFEKSAMGVTRKVIEIARNILT
jgi:predicted fused transcriptional regulator/phosphomethylpyrimidine kinase/transposase-like protein